jgi:hypothetical protein
MRTRSLILALALLLLAVPAAHATAPDSPFRGQQQFLDCDGNHESSSRQYKAWPYVWSYERSNPAKANLLRKIAEVPTVKWFAGAGILNRHAMKRRVERYLAAVDDPHYGGAECRSHLAKGHRDAYVGSYPVITLRAMQHYGCRGYDGGGAWNKTKGGKYKPWIKSFIDQFTKRYVANRGDRYQYWNKRVYPGGHFVRWRSRPGAVILEPDALGFIGRRSNCLTRSARAHRVALLTYAAKKISKLPNVSVYIDAGASDWLNTREAIRLLRKSGVRYARGFALNSTHFQSTRQELAFGNRIAKKLHKHFVINTAENAHGSLPKRFWSAGTRSKWCNPKNAGLGTQPTTQTGSKWADAYLWISRPGISSNGKVGVKACGIGPIGNIWFEQKGLWEARQANFAAPAWPPKAL